MGVSLVKGANVSLTQLDPQLEHVRVGLGWNTPRASSTPFDLDSSAFLLKENGKVRSDRDFIFYNQLRSSCNSVAHSGDSRTGSSGTGDDETIVINLHGTPPEIVRIPFCVTIHDAESRGQTFQMVERAYIRVMNAGDDHELARYDLSEDTASETAMIFGELYRHRGEWKFRAVGQGFKGGLGPLAQSYGIMVDDEEASKQEAPSPQQPVQPSPPPPPQQPVQPSPPPQELVEQTPAMRALQTQMQQHSPGIHSLSQQAGNTLVRMGMEKHRARVALCIDISRPMERLYQTGKIQKLAERVLAMGCRLDSNGAIDVFLFGQQAHAAGSMMINNFQGFIDRVIAQYHLEEKPFYGKVMQAVRMYYYPEGGGGIRLSPLQGEYPVYVMFVSNGTTNDEDTTRNQLQASSYEPFFWQFMVIGKTKKDVRSRGMRGFLERTIASDFLFLEQLDSMHGRYIDNANFFSVEDLDQLTDEALYDLLLNEYPAWVFRAKSRGLLP